jgi:hypothetical protein
MAAVSTSPVTTHALGNLVGTLFRVTPNDTPLTTAIGGLGQAGKVYSREFTWQTEDNYAAAQTAAVEGADPTYVARDRTGVTQVVQIFQYGVNISYSKLSAVDQLVASAVDILGNQPVQDETAHQLGLTMERAKRDLEYSVLRGSYVNPSDNATARKMRGLENAITTNSLDVSDLIGTTTIANAGDLATKVSHGLATGDEIYFSAVGTGGAPLAISTRYWAIKSTADTFQFATTLDNAVAGTALVITSDSAGTWTLRKANRLTKSVLSRLVRNMAGATDASGAPFSKMAAIGGAFNRQRITDLYGYAPEDRNYGGVSIKAVTMDIAGDVGVMFNRYMDPGRLFLVDLSLIKIVFMPIKRRGVFFIEPRADTGSSEHWQLYGEIGFEYGPEAWHGQVTGLTTDEQVV